MIVSLRCDCAFFLEKLEIIMCRLWRPECVARQYVYAWRLTPTDPTPKGKRDKPSLRELEQQIRRDIEDGIDSTGKKMTLCQLYAKQNAQRTNVKKSTQKQREQLMRLLKEDKLGARSIDTIKLSDAKEWALRMKDKGFSYNFSSIPISI